LRSDTQGFHGSPSTSSGHLTRYLALWFTHLHSAASTIVNCQLSIVNFLGFAVGSLMIAFSAAGQETPTPQPPPKYELIPAKDGGLPLDSKDCLAVIIGPTTTKAILEHRPEFRNEYEKVQIAPELIARWQAIEAPCTLVAVFGSWCGDSHHWAPGLIKLSETPNPFITIHWIGAYRDKTVPQSNWPAQAVPQQIEKVPTFWLFAPVPGGETKLIGSVVENPPKIGQTMAEALIELIESLH
jgi:hypothetical protein